MLYQTNNPHGGDVYGEPVVLDFSANTNPYGTPEGVMQAVQNALPRMHQYPDPYCRELVDAISAFEGVSSSFILCGNGAAELIHSYCAALCPGTAVELAPTFSEYSLGLGRCGCEIRRYSLHAEQDFLLDDGFLAFLEETKPEALFLCNPNNPTGRTVEPWLMEQILNHTRQHNIRFFLDECFLDLSQRGESLKARLRDNSQLFILKAFTKSYGMAGVRLGYGMSADENLLRKMSEAVQPWNVSSLAQAAGVAALKEQPFLQRARQTIFTQKAWLFDQLEALGLKVFPSDANFLLFYGPEGLHSALKQYGIAIRNCDNYHGLGAGWYRIAVRLPEENERLIQAMKQVLGKEETWRKTL